MCRNVCLTFMPFIEFDFSQNYMNVLYFQAGPEGYEVITIDGTITITRTPDSGAALVLGIELEEGDIQLSNMRIRYED